MVGKGEDRDVVRRIKALRKLRGMNQAAFAAFLGVPAQRLNNIETGRQPLSRDLAGKIRAKTGATTDWLWFGDARGLPHQLARELEEAESSITDPAPTRRA